MTNRNNFITFQLVDEKEQKSVHNFFLPSQISFLWLRHQITPTKEINKNANKKGFIENFEKV